MSDSASLRLELRFKNAALWNAVKKYMGFTDDSEMNLSSASIKLGIPRHQLWAYLNLRWSPWAKPKTPNQTLTVKASAIRLCQALNSNVFELFPDALYSKELPRLITKNVEPERAFLLGRSLELPPSPEESVYSKEKMAVIREVLETLTPQEQKVINMRFGLDGQGEMILEEVGAELGVSRERIRQIEASGLRRLRRYSRSRRLRKFIDVTAED